MNSELLKNKRVILKDGSIAYRLTTKIRIVNGKITNHYDSDIKQITPQILNQVKKLFPTSQIIKYKKAYYISELLDETTLENINQIKENTKNIHIHEALEKECFYIKVDDKLENIPVITDGTTSVTEESQDDIISISQLINIDINEVAKFIDFLTKFPYFAIETKTGKAIYELFKKNIDKIKVKIDKDTVFYRSRKWDPEHKSGWLPKDLWLPPEGKNNQARFNVVGVPYLYISDNSSILPKELRMSVDERRSTIKIANKSELYVFDLTNEKSPLFENCKRHNDEKNSYNYSLPNYIAQCLHYLKETAGVEIDGIMYFSVQDDTNKSKNYVLFEKDAHDFNQLDFIVDDK